MPSELRSKSVIVDEKSDNPERDFLQKKEIRFVSSIDCKPIDPPYLRLMTLRQYMEVARSEKQQN
jgi:hypothetical protein